MAQVMRYREAKQWRIVADGTPHGIQVFDELGRDVTHCICSVKWETRPDGVPAIAVELLAASLEVAGEVLAQTVVSLAVLRHEEEK